MSPRALVLILVAQAVACADDAPDRVSVEPPASTICFDRASEGHRALVVVTEGRPFTWEIASSAGILAVELDDEGTFCRATTTVAREASRAVVTMTCPGGAHFPRMRVDTPNGDRFVSLSVRATSTGACD